MLAAGCWILAVVFIITFLNPDRDREIIKKLSELVERYPRYGFPKLFAVLKREGCNWNHKRIHRAYCKMGLNMRRTKASNDFQPVIFNF